MFIYYTGTLLFRAWLLNDVLNQPLDVSGLDAEMFIKRSNDAEDVLFHFTSDGGELTLHSNEELRRSWLELEVSELAISPGDYVFYVYLNFQQKQLVEHSHLLVLANGEMEVLP